MKSYKMRQNALDKADGKCYSLRSKALNGEAATGFAAAESLCLWLKAQAASIGFWRTPPCERT